MTVILLVSKIVIHLISMITISFPLAGLTANASAEHSFETEIDIYYSNVGYYQGPTDVPIPEVVENDESSASKSTFEFGVGLILEHNKYTTALVQEPKNLQLVLRPSFKF